MNKIAVFVWAMLIGVVFFAGTAYAAEKFAYVDLSKVFSGYNKAKDYEKVLSDKQSVYETERDKMNLLSDKEKETKKADLENKIKSLQEFDRQKQMDLPVKKGGQNEYRSYCHQRKSSERKLIYSKSNS